MNPLFMPSGLGERGIVELPPSTPIYSRGDSVTPMMPTDLMEQLESIQRGDFGGDIAQVQAQLALTLGQFNRAITSATTNLPVRENLEAEAKLLVPIETPVRNMLPRVAGSGASSIWRTITSVGGGYGCYATDTTGANKLVARATTDSTAGMQAGDAVYASVSGQYGIVLTVDSATQFTLAAAPANNLSANEIWIKGPYAQPGAGVTAATAGNRAFFAESGAPADHATTYGTKTLAYKLMGTYFSVTGFAAAAGASFQNQIAMEKTNAIRTLMLNEENALINGSLTDPVAPWGTGFGGTAYGYNGLLNSITTALGTPAAQVQTAVGALTTAHADQQLTRLWNQGGSGFYIVCNAQELLSFKHLFEAAGSSNNVYRFLVSNESGLGIRVSGLIHPVTGEEVPILASRFCPAGTMIFGTKNLPDGSPGADVSVLPQVQLPQLAPTDMVQGYVAQELAPVTTAPQVYPGIVTLYSVFRLKSNLHFAKSTGLTAV